MTSPTMQHPDRPLRALAWISGSAFFFSLMSLLVKRLATLGVPQSQIVFWRVFFNCLFVAAVMLKRGEPFFPRGDRALLFFRGVCGFIAVTCLFASLAHLPLPVASILYWSSPLFVILLSGFVFRERLPRSAPVGCAVAFVGLALLLKVELGGHWFAYPAVAVGVGLLGSVAGAFAYLAVRKATERVGVNGIIFAFTGVASVLALPWALSEFQVPDALQAVQLLLLAVSAIIGQYLMTEGYRHAPAGVVSTMNLLVAAFSAVWGVLFFDESLDALQWGGMLLMALGIAAVTLGAGKRPQQEV
jgi:drug/metabolite transporter (DMT)-like permease